MGLTVTHRQTHATLYLRIDSTNMWLVYLVHGPGAGVYHGPASLVEPVAKLGVALVHVIGMGVAPIQLDIVNIPTSKRVGVFLRMVKGIYL